MPKKFIFLIVVVFLVGIFLALQGSSLVGFNLKKIFKSSNEVEPLVLSAATFFNRLTNDVFLKAGTKLVSATGNIYYLAEDQTISAGQSKFLNLQSALNNNSENLTQDLVLVIPNLNPEEQDKVYAVANNKNLVPLSEAIGSLNKVQSEPLNLNINSSELDQVFADLNSDKDKILAAASSTRETINKINQLRSQYETTRSRWQKFSNFFIVLWQQVVEFIK